MCDAAHAVMLERFEADVRGQALAEGGVPADDFRARFDEWLISDSEPTVPLGRDGLPLSPFELDYRRALGVMV